ncbi:DUF6153 family protein [Paenarthrobacter sp. PH39-S1]|uniref:DUF6153 family protein n=1 Tax=Paenarthrobacter sp. PH39-S1 TaxID=3046204 RepID=UPI0024B8C320|nr:DUF6153 family protein [Paenarthrobacter sp. PH39-S1]MDJ0354560.1 DUF6153 family protein [Paenarthrobacter sp. PH39-S1]
MSSTVSLPGIRSILRWGRLLIVVLGITGGILGMHVISGTPAMSMAPAAMTTSAATANAVTVSGPHAPVEQVPVICSCSAGCPGSMAMDACMPTFGPAGMIVPAPQTVTHLYGDIAFGRTPVFTAVERIPDGPSLSQLSVSRT